MFSILKDVIAVPDIATLSTHPILGISRYTYAPKRVCLAVNKFIEEQDGLPVWSLLPFCRGLLFQMLSLSNSQWQHWQSVLFILCCAPLDLIGLQRSSSLTMIEGDLLPGGGVCFVLGWHKADRLHQDCVLSWTIVVLLLALFCSVKAQKQACFVTLCTWYRLTLRV